MEKSVVLRCRFGRRVRTLLARTGLTIEELAASSTLSTECIEKILDGNCAGLTVSDMDMIARVFGTPLHGLLEPSET